MSGKRKVQTIVGSIEQLHANGVDKIFAAAVSERIHRDLGIDVTAAQAGRMLRDAGVKSTKTAAGTVFEIGPAATVLGELMDRF